MSTPSPKRILLWSPRGSGTHYNGPGSFAFRLYQEEALGTHSLTLAHSNPDQPATTAPFDSVVDVGSNVSNIRQLRTSGTWASTNSDRYDIFHGLGGFHPTVYPAWKATRGGLPAVLFPMLSGVEFSHKKGIGGLLRLPAQRRAMIRRFAAFVAMSSSIEDELLTCGVESSKIARIPMGIDCNRFSPGGGRKEHLRTSLGLSDRLTVVFCGSLTRRKQPHLLLEAMKVLAATLEVQVVFVGPIADEAYAIELKELASELPPAAQCLFVGHTTEPELYMRAADAFCLPSRNEGQPASVLEAMACELSVVVTPLPGLAGYIEESAAGFYTDAKAHDIADKLRLAFSTTSEQRQRARTKIQRYSSLGQVAAAHNRLFETVLAGGSPRSTSLEI